MVGNRQGEEGQKREGRKRLRRVGTRRDGCEGGTERKEGEKGREREGEVELGICPCAPELLDTPLCVWRRRCRRVTVNRHDVACR